MDNVITDRELEQLRKIALGMGGMYDRWIATIDTLRADLARAIAFNEENVRYWQGVRDALCANNDTLRADVARAIGERDEARALAWQEAKHCNVWEMNFREQSKRAVLAEASAQGLQAERGDAREKAAWWEKRSAWWQEQAETAEASAQGMRAALEAIRVVPLSPEPRVCIEITLTDDCTGADGAGHFIDPTTPGSIITASMFRAWEELRQKALIATPAALEKHDER